MVWDIGPVSGRDVQACSGWGVASWHPGRSEGPMRRALQGKVAEALVTFHDALGRERRLAEGAGRSQSNMRKGFCQPQPELLSNEMGGGEPLGTGTLLTGRPGGESRRQIQASKSLAALTVFSLDSSRSLVGGEEQNLISPFPKWESRSPDRTPHPRSHRKAAELGVKPLSAPSQAPDCPICFPNWCPSLCYFGLAPLPGQRVPMGPAQH